MQCKCGCGTEVPESRKNGFICGHRYKKNKPKGKPKPPKEAESPALVSLDLDESQLNRIWETLPLTEKGLAILTALTAVRE